MEVLKFFQQNEENIIDDIELLVKASSPSENKQLADSCKEVLQRLFRTYFDRIAQEIKMEEVGDFLKFTLGEGTEQILLVGHYDTVWDPGQIEFFETSDKVYGPGVLDMKGSLVSAIWTLKYFHDYEIPLKMKVVLFINSDEEIGSIHSRPYLEAEAKVSKAAFILEPPVVGTGDLKIARKGTSRYLLNIEGVAAHAGNNPYNGGSAITEAAKQILNINEQANPDKGTTINVGLVQGGGKLNVVPNEAEIGIDVRASTKEEQQRVDEFFEKLESFDTRVNVEVEGGINRPPMESTKKSKELFDIAQEEAEVLGFEVNDAKVGGASDGNFTAPIVRTLDGMGLVGDGIHEEHEHIVKEHLTERMALLANTLLEVMNEL